MCVQLLPCARANNRTESRCRGRVIKRSLLTLCSQQTRDTPGRHVGARHNTHAHAHRTRHLVRNRRWSVHMLGCMLMHPSGPSCPKVYTRRAHAPARSSHAARWPRGPRAASDRTCSCGWPPRSTAAARARASCSRRRASSSTGGRPPPAPRSATAPTRAC